MKQRPVLTAGTLVLAAAFLAGCATDDGMTDEDRDRYREAFGLEHEDWSDRPSLFRDLFGRDADDEAADDERIAQLEEAIRELEEQRSTRTGDREPVATDTPRQRVGLLLDGDADGLRSAFRDVAPDHPIVLLDDDATRESLSEAGCDVDDLAACAGDLAVYPGLRTVLTIEADGNQLRWHSYDVALDYRHTPRDSDLPEVDGAVPEAAWRTFADQALIATVDRLDAAPWHARAFSQEGDGWAINAGRASGLETGDRLAVRGEPSIIRNPSDRPVGWRPGARKGVVEIVEFAGDDIAVVELVEGDGPTETDVLVMEE